MAAAEDSDESLVLATPDEAAPPAAPMSPRILAAVLTLADVISGPQLPAQALPAATDDGAGVEARAPAVPPKDGPDDQEINRHYQSGDHNMGFQLRGVPKDGAPAAGTSEVPPVAVTVDIELTGRAASACRVGTTLLLALLLFLSVRMGLRATFEYLETACTHYTPGDQSGCVSDSHHLTKCGTVALAYSTVVLPVQPWHVLEISDEHPKRWIAPSNFGLPHCMICSAQITKTKLGLPSGVAARCFCGPSVRETTVPGKPRAWTLEGTNVDPASGTSNYTFGIGEYAAVHSALCSLAAPDQYRSCLAKAAAPMSTPRTTPLRVFGHEL